MAASEKRARAARNGWRTRRRKQRSSPIGQAVQAVRRLEAEFSLRGPLVKYVVLAELKRLRQLLQGLK